VSLKPFPEKDIATHFVIQLHLNSTRSLARESPYNVGTLRSLTSVRQLQIVFKLSPQYRNTEQ
jgi:hypothetical protein